MPVAATPDASDAIVSYAVAEPYRPWHAHRAFSREARGLPPWKPRKALRDASNAHSAPPTPAARKR